MQCYYCKQEIEAGDRFCCHCGKEQPRAETTPESAGRYCAGCGERVEPSQAFCMSCGARLATQSAQEEARRPAQGVGGGQPLPDPGSVPLSAANRNVTQTEIFIGVGVARRFPAFFLDRVLLCIIMGLILGTTEKDLIYWAESFQYGYAFGVEYWVDTMVNSNIVIISIFIVFGYYALFEGVLGWTPGKFLTGLRVVQKDGISCGIGRALIRNILRIVDGLGLYLVAAIFVWCTSKNQRMGDLVAGTLVVKKGDPRPE